METFVVPVDAVVPQPEVIGRAARLLRDGGLVAFPTETVYGLGANALDPVAVAGIFAAKGRPANNPIIVHVADAPTAQTVADWTETAARLAERFWPGPLTMVLPRRLMVPDIVTAGGPTVAVRVPAHPVARALIRRAEVPLAAPSANRSTQLSPTRADHVLRGLGGRIPLILDGGPTAGGLESTVLDVTCSPPRLLRPGLVSLADIEAFLGTRLCQASHAPGSTRSLPSPGMMARHYAPRAVLECAPDEDRDRVEGLCRRGLRVGWLTFLPPPISPVAGLRVVQMPRDPIAYATRLYAVLHTLDDDGRERIVATLPPETEEWQAVRDRLQRAATRP
jgi:L-threonylcarbamoyladenylate synthase